MNRSPAIVTRAEENTNNLQNLDGVVVDRKEEEIAPVENHDEQIAQKLKGYQNE